MDKGQAKKLLQLYVELLKEAEFGEDFKIKKTTTYVAKDSEYTEKRNFEPSRKLSVSEKSKLTKFQELLKEKYKDDQELLQNLQNNLQLQIGYNKGEKLVSVEGLERLNFKEDGTLELTDEQYVWQEGKVTLIDFWATWCGPCQQPMAHNEEMLKKNEEQWKDKVQIVGLSMDNDAVLVEKRVTSKDWKRITHYRFKNGWDSENETVSSFEIDGIPFVALLNKFGRIVYFGHPSEIKLEEEINRLIEETEDKFLTQNLEVAGEPEKLDASDVENFKKVKQFLRNQWKEYTKDYTPTPNQFVELKIKKSYEVNQQGQKISRKLDKPIVNYKFKLENKEFIDNGVKLIKENLPESFVTFGKQIINDPKANFQKHLKFLKDTCAKYEIPVEFVHTIDQNFTLGENKIQASEEKSVKQLKSADPKFISSAKQIREEFVNYFQQNREANIEDFVDILRGGISFSLASGDKFIDIGNLHAYGNQDETLQISHQEGQVLVVDVWAYWCGPCVGGMGKSSKMLKENKEKWGNKVRFVAISLEGESDSKELIEKNPEWKENVELLFFKDGRDNPAPGIYGVQYIPHYVIVGKDGTIRLLGSCSTLKETIEKLVEEEAVQQSGAVSNDLSESESEQLTSFLQNKDNLKQFEEMLANQKPFTIKFQLTVSVKRSAEENKVLSVSQPKLKIWTRDTNKHIVDEFTNKLFNVLPKEKFQIDETVSKTVEIPFPGTNCGLCNAELNDQTPQYYSPWSKKHYCCSCAEFEDKEKKGNDQYKITDTLVFINAPITNLDLLKNIDEYTLGKNLQVKEGEEGSQNHSYCCNGCDGCKQGARYISIASRPGYQRDGGYIDFCSACFEKLRNKDTEAVKKIIERNEGFSLEHPLLRVLFHHGYQEF